MMHFFKILFRVLIPTTEDLKSFLVFICAVLVLLVLGIVIVVYIIKWIFGVVIARGARARFVTVYYDYWCFVAIGN